VRAALVVALLLGGCDFPAAQEAPRDEPRVDARRTSLPPIDPPRARGPAPSAPDNAELAEILAADVADHASIASGDELARRDAARRARVLAILSDDGARTGADFFAVATVLDHGTSLEDFASARRYAVVAAKLGERRGVRLAAQAWDRWLVRAGYPQRFGTMAACDADGCTLHVYEASTTDEERARWDLPPLRALKDAADRSRRLP